MSQGDVASVSRAAFIRSDDGAAVVSSRILSLGHLWQEIRVKGGAYGGSFERPTSGNGLFVSWNDPNPLRSMDVYEASPSALRKEADGDVTPYIVSALSKIEPYLTPSGEMDRAVAVAASGRSPAYLSDLAKSITSVKGEDVKAFADILEKAIPSMSLCVVGGEGKVKECSSKLDAVETVMAGDDGLSGAGEGEEAQ